MLPVLIECIVYVRLVANNEVSTTTEWMDEHTLASIVQIDDETDDK